MRILVSFSDCLTTRSSQHLPVKKFTCMRVSVSQKTPNTMIYGELGRCPLYINMVMKAVKYWLNLVEPPDNRLPKAASETVKSLDDKGVKILGQRHKDMSVPIRLWHSIWGSQQVENKTGFLQEPKQRLTDCNIQDWHDKISKKRRRKI